MSRVRAIGAVVVVLAASVAVSSHRPALATHRNPPRAIYWLGAGDSYSAGFGLPGVDLVTSGCAQSNQAWPALAKARVTTLGYKVAPNGFRHVACPGALTKDVLTQLADNPTGRPDGKGWDLVTLNAGGTTPAFPTPSGSAYSP